MSLIIAKNIKKEFNLGSNKIIALHDVNFNIESGEFVVILGPSGAGKTTLLNLIGGMDKLSEGELISCSINLTHPNDKDLTLYRKNKIGFVFQFYNLMPNLTAKENVELACELNKKHLDINTILKEVGLENRMDNFPSQLSGGEQQRTSIARALAKNPDLLLCDEPTGALDYQTGKMILALLKKINKEKGTTIILVTHNQAIKDMADKIIYIKNGTINNIEINQNIKDIEEIEW